MPTKEQIARSKRAAVMDSTAFKEWYGERRKIGNPPKNPYQAYMTDLSLRAELEHREKWARKPNRLDTSNVDYPWTHAPAPKRREPSRKHEHKGSSIPFNRPIPYVKTPPLEDEVKAMGERMAMHYGTGAPTNFEFHRNTGPAIGQAQMKVTVFGKQVVYHNIRLGTKGGSGSVKGVAAHEIGHFIHASANKQQLSDKGIESPTHIRTQITGPVWRLKAQYADEKAAWTIGETAIKHFNPLEQRQAHWQRRMALETYRNARQTVIPVDNPKMKIHKFLGRIF